MKQRCESSLLLLTCLVKLSKCAMHVVANNVSSSQKEVQIPADSAEAAVKIIYPISFYIFTFYLCCLGECSCLLFSKLNIQNVYSRRCDINVDVVNKKIVYLLWTQRKIYLFLSLFKHLQERY